MLAKRPLFSGHPSAFKAINSPQANWARWDSNPEPKDYESSALTVELQALVCGDLVSLDAAWDTHCVREFGSGVLDRRIRRGSILRMVGLFKLLWSLNLLVRCKIGRAHV